MKVSSLLSVGDLALRAIDAFRPNKNKDTRADITPDVSARAGDDGSDALPPQLPLPSSPNLEFKLLAEGEVPLPIVSGRLGSIPSGTLWRVIPHGDSEVMLVGPGVTLTIGNDALAGLSGAILQALSAQIARGARP